MKLTIDRSIWLRGEGHRGSKLFRLRDNKMCPVGILLEKLGVPREALADMIDVRSLTLIPVAKAIATSSGLLHLSDLGYVDSTPWAQKLYTINDACDIEEDRERKLTAAFREGGIEVTFVDGPTKE